MSDAPEKIWTNWEEANGLGVAFDEPPQNDGEGYRQEYIRADLCVSYYEAHRIRSLRSILATITDPDFIWAALDNVHDMDTSLEAYAAAVSKAQRAAIEGVGK